MSPNNVEILAGICFLLALLHTFSSSFFHNLGSKFPEGSIRENIFHLLGEVEVVFGLWAGIFFLLYGFSVNFQEAIAYTEGRSYVEPLFVFVVMIISATRPVLELGTMVLKGVSKSLVFGTQAARFYFSLLFLGPLLGSFITEPAAMTICALLLRKDFVLPSASPKLKYITMATLFVNISIGGVLTPFAAPPVLMVAKKWEWDLAHMLSNFGWKAAIAVFVNALAATLLLRKELKFKRATSNEGRTQASPVWLAFLHVALLLATVVTNHHPVIFMGVFLSFLAVTSVTREFQDELKLKEGLLVSFFLAGLVVLGGLQDWWLRPLLTSLGNQTLFFGAAGLTAITDNAALTYLGSQVEGVSDSFKYFLVAGAVAGGGLTVIANAPNPAGHSILQDAFGDDGVKIGKLFLFALPPTFVALLLFSL